VFPGAGPKVRFKLQSTKHMASAEHEPITAVWGRAGSELPAGYMADPLVRGTKPPSMKAKKYTIYCFFAN